MNNLIHAIIKHLYQFNRSKLFTFMYIQFCYYCVKVNLTLTTKRSYLNNCNCITIK